MADRMFKIKKLIPNERSKNNGGTNKCKKLNKRNKKEIIIIKNIKNPHQTTPKALIFNTYLTE